MTKNTVNNDISVSPLIWTKVDVPEKNTDSDTPSIEKVNIESIESIKDVLQKELQNDVGLISSKYKEYLERQGIFVDEFYIPKRMDKIDEIIVSHLDSLSLFLKENNIKTESEFYRLLQDYIIKKQFNTLVDTSSVKAGPSISIIQRINDTSWVKVDPSISIIKRIEVAPLKSINPSKIESLPLDSQNIKLSIDSNQTQLFNIIDNLKKTPLEVVQAKELDPVVTQSFVDVVVGTPFLASIGLILLGVGLIYYFNNKK